MPLRIEDLDPRIRQKIVNSDPVLKANQDAINRVLEEECVKAELFMQQYGPSERLTAMIAKSRAFINGDITAEEMLER